MTDVAYFRRGRYDFASRGVRVNAPVDRLADGKFPLLQNVIVGIDGTLEQRPGLTDRYPGGYGPVGADRLVHSMKRLNDPTSGTALHLMVYGIGTTLYYQRSAVPGTIVNNTTGYSGLPLSLIPYRPANSPQPWMYVGDGTQMKKLRYHLTDTVHRIGLRAPTFEPVPFASSALFKVIELGATAAPPWILKPGTGDPTTPPTVTTGIVRVAAATTFTGGVFEAADGSNSITIARPSALTGINTGMVLTITGPAGNILVTQTNKPTAVVTITSILYDSGTTGLCSIVLSNTPRDIVVNSLLINTTLANKYARVRSVNDGPDGSVSLRVSTAETWAATQNVNAVASIVLQTGGVNVLGAGSVASTAVEFHQNAPTPAGNASIFYQFIALDLSTLTGTSINQPSTLDDWMEIGIRTDHPERIEEIKLLLDVDADNTVGTYVPATGLSTGLFTKNYFFRAISKSDLSDVTRNTQLAIDNRKTVLARRIYDSPNGTTANDNRYRHLGRYTGETPGGVTRVGDPNSPNQFYDPVTGQQIPLPGTGSGGTLTPGDGGPDDDGSARGQLSTGDQQWTQVRFRLSDLIRVGSDSTRGLQNVQAIGISINATACLIDINSWIIRGGFAPDVTNIQSGYQYAYRARASVTGVVSDLSPLSRSYANASRQQIAVQLAQITAVPEVDYLDVFRIGGALPFPAYVGTMLNSAVPVFVDKFSDTAVNGQADAGGTFNIDEPDLPLWPIPGLPVTSTTSTFTATASGTTVVISGTISSFIDIIPGSLFVINGIPTTLYRFIGFISSTTVFEVTDNLGSFSGAAWTCNQPYYTDQRMPILFGPFHDHLFGCGDPYNPGSLYFTKPKNVDNTNARRRLEITDNSDILQNGFVFNGRGGVFSTQRLYYLEYNPGASAGAVFIANETPNVKGLYARWAIAIGRHGVAWLADDGIYIMEGGGAKSLTDRDLRPLFPFRGKVGVDTNGVSAPVMPNPVGVEEKYLRLAYDANDNLHFFYRDGAGALKSMFYDFALDGWFPMVYQKSLSMLYAEEGQGVNNTIAGSDETPGHVYTVGGTADTFTDAGTGFPCIVQYPSVDEGDPRSQKQYGDAIIDINPAGNTVTVQAGFNNFATTIAAITITGAARINPPTIYDFAAGSGTFSRNISTKYTWTSVAAQSPRLHTWEPSFLAHPEDTLLRATDYHADGGARYIRGIWLEADTAGIARTVLIEYTTDAGAVVTFTLPAVTHTVKSRIYYPISTPFYAMSLRIRPTDAAKWKLYGYDLEADPAPPRSTEYQQWTDDGEIGAKFLQGMVVSMDTAGALVTFNVYGDNNVLLLTTAAVSTTDRSEVAFAFNPAVRTHIMRIVPASASCRVWGVKWLWQHDAEVVSYYEAQETSFDLPGFKHVREVYVAYAAASSPLTLTLYADGTAIAGIPALPASAAYTRQRILIPANKFKALRAVLSSASTWRHYSRDCAIYVKPWGSSGDYAVTELFGTMHRDRGIAQI